MSDESQGPGWWEASDGKWYPPEQVPGTAPPADAPSTSPDSAPSDWPAPAPSDYAQQPAWGQSPGYAQPQGYGQAQAYGQPPYGQAGGYTYGYAPGQQFSNGIGIAAMVLGIIAVVLFWFIGVSWILALLAVIFGGVGISKANRGEANNKGMAVAGIVCGSLVIAFWVIVFIAAAASN